MILVTGGSGLVGNHLKEILPEAVFLSSKDYNLIDITQSNKMIKDYNPDTVVHLAARVGGLLDNINRPVNYFEENILMNTNVIKSCYDFGVSNFITTLSTCIYPDIVNRYPMKETQMFDGPPPNGNFHYAIAKRAMLAQIKAYNKQYDKKWSCLIPCNLYGEYDKYEEHHSHFVGALIKKIYQSKNNEIELWGTGKPLRQFMYGGDLARVIKYMILNSISGIYNVAPDYVHSINEIANIALKSCGKDDLNITYDNTKPDGQYRKDVDSSKLLDMLNEFKFTPLSDGIKKTYNRTTKKW